MFAMFATDINRSTNYNIFFQIQEDEPNAVQRAQSLPPMSDKKEKNKRGQADTTSEDEKNKGGTLDSAPIDRAKSFEYFPGESFPLQENSSSYEYLPGI